MLTDRQRRILWSVVNTYVASAEPVGSRLIAERSDLGVSAATVRNDMADLEAMGFLKQPHTSAGRIPAQKGYRFYVDHLSLSDRRTRCDTCTLHEGCFTPSDPMETVFKQVTSALAQLTQCVTVLLSPGSRESHLLHLQMVSLSDQLLLVILVTDLGHVFRQRTRVPEGVALPTLERLVDSFNERFRGQSLESLCRKGILNWVQEFSEEVRQIAPLAEFIYSVLDMEEWEEERLYASGTKQVLMQPEFRDREQVRALLDLMEEDRRVVQLLAVSQPSDVSVRIGYENELVEMHELSVITTSYQMDGEPVGVLGVIGPMRMDYGKVMGLLDLWARGVSHWLHRVYE